MSNYYTTMASSMCVPEEKQIEVVEMFDRLKAEDFGIGGVFAYADAGHVVFVAEENFFPENFCFAAAAIVDKFEILEPFLCSWSYSCDKEIIDAFGGGAAAIIRGQEPYIVDAFAEVNDFLNRQLIRG